MIVIYQIFNYYYYYSFAMQNWFRNGLHIDNYIALMRLQDKKCIFDNHEIFHLQNTLFSKTVKPL